MQSRDSQGRRAIRVIQRRRRSILRVAGGFTYISTRRSLAFPLALLHWSNRLILLVPKYLGRYAALRVLAFPCNLQGVLGPRLAVHYGRPA
jgi:hypothetical protein